MGASRSRRPEVRSGRAPRRQRGALDGVRVVDFGQIWAGPVAGHLLGDLGAQVIHVESKAHRSSVLTQDLDQSPVLPWNNIGRNKLDVSLDLRHPEAIELTKRLVSVSDVVTENFAPRVMEHYGLHYDALRRVKPDIIMLSISGAGQRGPFSDLLAYGPSMNAVAGTDSLVGYPEDGGLVANMWEPDPAGSVLGVYAVMVALYERRRTGKGQHIDLSFLDLLTSFNAEPLIDLQFNGRVAAPQGNRDPVMAPHGIYPCAGTDAWVSIAVESEEEWQALCQVAGQPGWALDPRFSDRLARLHHRDALDALVGEWTATRPAEDVAASLQAAGVAAYAVHSIADLLSDPQEQARQREISTRIPGVRPDQVFYGNPWHLSDTPASITRPTPDLGEHNDLVLGELMGLSRLELDRLSQVGVVS